MLNWFVFYSYVEWAQKTIPRVLSRAPGTAGGSRLRAYGYGKRTMGSSFSLRVFAPGIGILRITERAEGATLAYLAEDRKTGAILTWGPDSSPKV